MSNKSPHEDGPDITIDDLEKTHKFKHLLTNDLVNECLHGETLGEYAQHVMRLVAKASELGCIDQAAVNLGVDFEDPTHQAYLEAADAVIAYYDIFENNED